MGSNLLFPEESANHACGVAVIRPTFLLLVDWLQEVVARRCSQTMAFGQAEFTKHEA